MIDFRNTKRVGLLAKIGRGHYSRSIAEQVRPAEPRIERALYLRWVRSVFTLWRHFVQDKIVNAARTDARKPRIPKPTIQTLPPEPIRNRLLSTDWDELVDRSGLNGLLDRIGRSLADRNQTYFNTLAKVPVPRVPGQAAMIADFRARNIDLIKSAGVKQVGQINDVISAGNAAGLRHEEISQQIQDRIGVGESQANLIARDQTLKFNSSIHTAQATAAGSTDFTWSTSHDGAVRPTHRELDGKRFRYDDPPVTNDDGDRNLPGEDYQCRCVAIPVIDLFAGIDDAEG